MLGYGIVVRLGTSFRATFALNTTALYSNSTTAASSTSSSRSTSSSWVAASSDFASTQSKRSSLAQTSSGPASIESNGPASFSSGIETNTTGSSVFASTYLSAGLAASHAWTGTGSTGVLSASTYLSNATAAATNASSILPTAFAIASLSHYVHSSNASHATGFVPSGSIQTASLSLNATNGTQSSNSSWDEALSCNADWHAWSSEYITSGIRPNATKTVTYTGSDRDFVTPEDAIPYTPLCDGRPRAHGEASYSMFTHSGSYEMPSYTMATLPHITTPACSIPPIECEKMWASYSSGDAGIHSAPNCPRTCVPKYHTTWLGSSLPPCYIRADEVEVAYWPVAVEGDLCGNRSTVVPTNTGIPTAATWGTTVTSPGVLASFRKIYAVDQCSSTIGDVLSGYILSQQTAQISTQCGAYHQGGSPGTQVNFADFNFPYPASAYSCLPQCGNGVGGMENYCHTLYDNFNPQIAFPTDVFDIKPEWKSCKIEHLGNIINDPPKALTQVAAPAEPTAPAAGNGPTTPATPQQPPPQTTVKPTGGVESTGNQSPGDDPSNGEDPSESDSGGEGRNNGGGGSSGNEGDGGGRRICSGNSGGSSSGGTYNGGSNGGSNGDSNHPGSDRNGLNGDGSNSGSNGAGSSNGGSSGSGSNGNSNNGGGNGDGAGSGSNVDSSSNSGSSPSQPGQDPGQDGNGGSSEGSQDIGGIIASILGPTTRQPAALPQKTSNSGASGSDGVGGQAGAGAVVQLGSGQVTAVAVGNAGAIQVAGQTLCAGQAATIDGHIVSNGGNNIVVDGSITAPMARITADPGAQSGAVISGSSCTSTALASDGTVVVDGQTLTPEQVGVINGRTYSDASTALVVDGKTLAFSRLQSTAGPLTEGAVLTLGSATLTAFEIAGTAIIDEHTLTSGEIITISGHTISDAGTALVIDGKTTVPFSELSAQTTPTLGAVFTIGGHVSTATNLPNGAIVVDGTTLHRGGAAMTVNGVRVSVGPDGLVVGSRTVAASTLSPDITAADHETVPANGGASIEGRSLATWCLSAIIGSLLPV